MSAPKFSSCLTRFRFAVAPRRGWAGLVLALCLAVVVPAQRRITVGGPGADHPDLPDAVDVARDGDVILVAPGSFHGATVRRGVCIVGSPGTVLRSALEFRGLRGGTHAAAVGLTLQEPLLLDRCRGTVLVQDCAGQGLPFHRAPGVEIRGCSHAAVTGLWGFGYLEVRGSTVSLTRASFAGRIAEPTLSVEGSFVQVARSDVLGANSSATSNPMGRFPPASAAFVESSVLALDGLSSLQAGLNLGDNDFVVPALFGSDSVLLLDPHSRLYGTRSLPVLGVGLQAWIRSLPSLDLGGFSPYPGRVSSIQVIAPARAPVLLFGGVSVQPVVLGSAGIWMLDTERSQLIASGIAQPVPGRGVGRLVVSIPVPARPELRGFSMLLQSIAWTDQGVTYGVPLPFVVR